MSTTSTVGRIGQKSSEGNSNHRNHSVRNEVGATVAKLLNYCKAEGWAGYDPYDVLNSRLFKALPFLNYRVPRILFTQAFKRSPVNLRPLLLVPKTVNAKGVALFLSAFLKLSDAGQGSYEDLCTSMVDRLSDLRFPDDQYSCWGYSFPWQTRTIVVPAGTPNLVCTLFVANALLDMYEQRGDQRCFSMAVSSAHYILDKLYWYEDAGKCGFDYPQPGLRSQIHNANLLASAFLCRVCKLTGETGMLGPALNVARYSAAAQQSDGSWFYGEKPSQHWIDNFHTGYNLSALRQIGEYLGTDEFLPYVEKGFEFYKSHFIREDGVARYFHEKTYPIDIHCIAQSILTLLEFQYLDSENEARAISVFKWAMQNMWDEHGFFYYRALRSFKVKTSYMRWSQAWMLLALSTLLCELNSTETAN